MSTWRTVNLGSFITFQRGFDLTEKQSTPGDFPVISSGGSSYTTNIAKVNGPGVVTGRKGVLGKVHWSEGAFWPHDTTLWVKDFKEADPRFVYYLLRTLPLAELDAGAANPTLNRNHAHLLSVLVPDVSTQKSIATVLRVFDDLIDNNRRRVEVLEEMARAIYHEWFVKLRYPGHEGVPMVDSALGKVPEKWDVVPIDKVARVVRGRSYKSAELVDSGGLPFVNLKCMARGGGFRRDGLKRYNGRYKDEQVVGAGDLVMAVTDLTQGREILARPAIVPELDGGQGVISLDVVRLVPLVDQDRLWLFASTAWSSFPNRLKEFANGSTVLHLSPAHIVNAPILWPPGELRTQLASLIEPCLVHIEKLSNQLQSLTALRDALLPKLVTGQIDVSKLELDTWVSNSPTQANGLVNEGNEVA